MMMINKGTFLKIGVAGLLGLLFCLSPLGAEVSFSGEVSTSLSGLFSGDDFESPLNPGNSAGLDDFFSSQEVVFKLDGMGYDEGAGGGDGFSLWASVESYPIGAALLGLASTSEPLTDGEGNVLASPVLAAYELNSALGDTLLILDLMRLSYTWSPDAFSFTLGRQSYLTGYGYGWNPMDLVSPMKDPADPKAELKGSDGLSLSWDSGSFLTLKLYGLYDPAGSGTASFEDLKGGGEAVLFLSAAELRFAGLWGADEEETSDTPNAVSLGFLIDILGAGFYAEGALRQYPRLGTPAASGESEDAWTISVGEEWVVSVLGGCEYYLPTGTVLIFEYFYNGEGFDQDEMAVYEEALEAYGAAGGIPTAFSSLYNAGYYARHYGLVNILHSFWDPFQIDLNLSGLGSFDTATLSVMGALTIYPTGSLSISGGYAGIFGLDGEKYNEADLSPVTHSISLEVKYSF